MAAYGAEIVLTPKSGGMEYARDLADQMQREGKGKMPASDFLRGFPIARGAHLPAELV